MHNYAWLCMIMYNYAWLCIMSSLRFCHERGQIKRWGAVRHVKRSGISIRVFLVLTKISIVFQFLVNNVKQIGFQTCGRFMICWRLFETNVFFRKCPRSVPEVVGTILDLFLTNSGPFRTNSDKNRLKHIFVEK